jgi:hypothetical protein
MPNKYVHAALVGIKPPANADFVRYSVLEREERIDFHSVTGHVTEPQRLHEGVHAVAGLDPPNNLIEIAAAYVHRADSTIRRPGESGTGPRLATTAR